MPLYLVANVSHGKLLGPAYGQVSSSTRAPRQQTKSMGTVLKSKKIISQFANDITYVFSLWPPRVGTARSLDFVTISGHPFQEREADAVVPNPGGRLRFGFQIDRLRKSAALVMDVTASGRARAGNKRRKNEAACTTIVSWNVLSVG